jgi:hypothetical protein
MTPVRPSVNTLFAGNFIKPSWNGSPGRMMPNPWTPPPKKGAAPEGAAEFREETSKKAAGGEPLCCGAQISPFSRKGKRHSFTIRYALTAGPPAAHP